MSRLARLSLANRSVVALLTLAIAVFGWISLGSLKQELIPSLQIPTAVVVAVDPGSSPQLVEQQITVPVEQAVRAVEGVEGVTSSSATGVSTTTVELEYGGDLDASAQALQQAVDRVRSSLPSGVEPSVFTGSIDDFPVVQLAISGGTGMDDAALAALVQDTVVPRFEQIDGVRDVTVTGIADDAVTVALDLPALAAAGLSPTDVATILQDNGVVLPTGTVDDGDTTLSVQVGSELASIEDLESLPLVGAEPVTLGDVADVTVAPVGATSYSRLDGEPALAVGLTKTPDGNTVDVSHAAQEAVADLEASLGDDVQVAVVFDQAPFIEESIHGLATEGALGLVFAVLVILLFLGSVRSTLVSAISIPLSLLVTFVGLQVGGYSLNILTLGALTIAIGRVVDDSIVVIENIKRHLSYGEAKSTAILTAVREVAGAITASTVTTVAVFLPIALVGGMVGELFRPFAVTVAVAMTASLFVALTIVPVLAYWFIKAAPSTEGSTEGSTGREDAEQRERAGLLQRSYLATLTTALRRPVLTLGAAVLVFVGTLALVPRLETNFLGDAGQDTLTVTETFAPGTSLAAQDAAAQQVEEALMGVDGVTTVQTTVGSSGGIESVLGGSGTPRASFALTLDGDVDPEVVQEDVRAAARDLGQTAGEVTVAGAGAAFGSSTVDVIVRSDDPDQLGELAQRVQEMVEEVDGVSDVTNNLAAAQPTVQVVVDRAAAAAAGLTETQVAGTVAALMSPQPIGTVDLGDGPLDVTIEGIPGPTTLDDLRAVVLPTATGMVPLAQVASIDEVDVPTSVTRVDGDRSATVSATPTGQDLGAVTTALQAQIDELDVPAGASVAIGGIATEQQDAFADLGLALLIAIAIVYLVMVATFRSLLQPVILLVSVPFAATGALLALLLTRTPLGVPALIGVLMLIGIVVTNAIVLIDLVNQYRAAGRPLAEAVLEGARKRLRPILMTAAATIFALTPMAFGLTGGGVFISKPLAIVVIGGLVTSTLLTLVLVPVLYTLAEKAKERGARRRDARRA
ncbi:efflux RND transporter permease subunit [Cellulomonas fengjieae]|uniref:efflux RND transporter permease subunit n=1 Tax=Cellulomonas fengjieae TaxID=2819978 RepID=UPI001AAE8EDE|nr:efflux RND transporter permease subunit [Cellulomonas fengjieae]MBO3100516.1 efflux RND transporter permease subunit [Cellulomonas fengjieae]